MVYLPVWPRNILFFCQTPPPKGGETPICVSNEVCIPSSFPPLILALLSSFLAPHLASASTSRFCFHFSLYSRFSLLASSSFITFAVSRIPFLNYTSTLIDKRLLSQLPEFVEKVESKVCYSIILTL